MGAFPAAVLFDFDGTLVDTETVWEQVERGLARDLGGELPHDYHLHTIGGTVERTSVYIVATVGSDADPADVAAELWRRMKSVLAEQPIRWLPGARELLGAVVAAGIPRALVSSGHRHYLDVTVDRLPPGAFDVVVGGDEVEHNKPHPDPYLRACTQLGVDPAACVVLEDSASGAASGNAAGCAVVVVPSLPGSVPDAPRRVLRDTWAGLGVADLAELADRARVSP